MYESLLSAELWGTVFETLLYGVYLILFGWNLFILYQRAEERKQHSDPQHRRDMQLRDRTLLVGVVLQCIAQTTHWCASITRTHAGFVGSGPAFNGALRYFSTSLDVPSTIIALESYFVGGLLLHSLLIYRTFLVWDRRIWPIVLPVFVNVLHLITSFILCVEIIRARTLPNLLADNSPSLHWAIALYSLDSFIALYVLVLIGIPIIRTSRELRQLGLRSSTTPILWILIESASLHCALILIILLLFICKSVWIFFALHISGPIVGMSYSLIMIRTEAVTARNSYYK